jgi:hypothetical protein
MSLQPQAKRRSYCEQENTFLKECFNIVQAETSRTKWEIIAMHYSETFPMICPRRTAADLREHFEKNLHSNQKKGPLTTEEMAEIEIFVSEKGRKWMELSLQMNRNVNQLKNAFNRKLKKQNGEKEAEELINFLTSVRDDSQQIEDLYFFGDSLFGKCY